MKFNLYKSVVACALMALATGCHDFEALNTNPYARFMTRLWEESVQTE